MVSPRPPRIDLTRFESWDERGGTSALVGGRGALSGIASASSPYMGQGGRLGGLGAGAGGVGGRMLGGLPLFEARTPAPTQRAFPGTVEAPTSAVVPSPPPGEEITRPGTVSPGSFEAPAAGPGGSPPGTEEPASPTIPTPAAAVPEPSTRIGALAGGLLLAWKFRRRDS